MSPLPRTTPEAQGIASTAISAFVSAVEREVKFMHSFMLVRHGHVVAEGWWKPYQPDDPHVLFSLSKSFTSTAIGLLAAEGRLSVDDPVLSFFPEQAPPQPSEYLQAMRVRHLLSMSTGHTSKLFERMDAEPTWVDVFLTHPVEYAPGTYWLYNSFATYMLSAIVQKLTGGRMIDYLRPRLFEPLGITEKATWERSPEGIDVGGWGLSVTTADIAALGQLYLQKGTWNGVRILPESWVDEATSMHTDNSPHDNPEWRQGYGYQFWRCRHNAYRGDGAFGQYCVVMPEQDAVLAITSGLDDMQRPLDLVWEHLLPAMQAAPLPPNEQAQAALARKLASLELPHLQGAATSPTAARVSGRTFTLAENPEQFKSVVFTFSPEQAAIRFSDDVQIACGYGHWAYSTVMLLPLDYRMRGYGDFPSDWKVAASGAWTDDNTYTAKVWWIETPFAVTLTCRFDGDTVSIAQRGNVGFAGLQGATFTGQLS